MAQLANTALDVFPLCLGGSVFGWTANKEESFAVLDAYAEAGGNFIDTADSYMAVIPGNSGGESESIIGQWIAARRNRDRIVLATKVGMLPGLSGLSARTIHAACEQSLRRLDVDHIDLYYAHVEDPDTPLEESMRAFDALVRAGKVRYLAVSNFSAAGLSAALDLAPIVAIQPHYNLMERTEFEGDLADLAFARGLATVPYFALAKGFLTGKYRPHATPHSPRAAAPFEFLNDVDKYLTDRGRAVLSTLDSIAAAHGTTVAAVALAWLRSRPTVIAPCASARTVDQLRDLLPSATLTLTADEVDRLSHDDGVFAARDQFADQRVAGQLAGEQQAA